MTDPLRWSFGPSGSEDHGPKDSITTTFKGNKYYSLAREVIQNSLDAALDDTQPVKVSFTLFEISRDDLPGVFGLDQAIHSCRENYSSVQPFVEFCNSALELLSNDSLKCLRIGDFNTKGLDYHGTDKSAFYAFMKAVGFTQKSTNGSGGSFGFGKGAYYAASLLRTLMVSSIYGDGPENFVFQGKARLTTHFDKEGNKKDYIGLFGGDDREPVLDRSLVPEFLRRTERGTDVILVGFDDNSDTWREHLIKSILNNFWLAIWDGKLVVKIGADEINKENLEQKSEIFFGTNDNDGKSGDPETWNPLPYLRAVKYIGSPNNRYFENTLPTLGKVQMYIYLREGLPNRTVYMRSPKMTVFKRGRNRSINYVGVFVCDDREGNKILREMENPEHNQWKKTNYLDGEIPHKDAAAAELELRGFVSDCLDALQVDQNLGHHQIYGLDEYLSIPEDLLPDQDGEGNNSDYGDSVSDIDADETAVESLQRLEEPRKMKIPVTKTMTPLPASGDAVMGDDLIFTGGVQGGDHTESGSAAGPNPGNEISKGSFNGQDPVKKPVSLRQRVVAQRDLDGRIHHIVKLFSDDFVTADIYFFAGVDSESKGDGILTIRSAKFEGRELSYSDNGLSSVTLSQGENVLKIGFDSDQKHSLRIAAYKEESLDEI